MAKRLEKATETAEEKFGEFSSAKAQAVWNQLRPNLEEKEATTDVKHPEDQELRIALRVQLKKLLDWDKVLCNAIANHHRAGVTVIAPKLTRQAIEPIENF